MQRSLHFLAFGLTATLLLLTLAGFAGRWHPAFEVIENFRLHLAVLAGPLVVVLGLTRLRRSAGLALLTVLIATAGPGPVFDPAERPGVGRPLTLLYANLWDQNPQPQALAAMLIAADADILITSETQHIVTQGAASLSAAYPYRLLHFGTGPALRTAIWSKYPLLDGELYLNNTIAPTAAAATADLGDGTKLGLIGAHFSRPFERLHQTQVEALGPMSQKLAAPLVVVADFNASSWSRLVASAAEVTDTRILGGYRVHLEGSLPDPSRPAARALGPPDRPDTAVRRDRRRENRNLGPPRIRSSRATGPPAHPDAVTPSSNRKTSLCYTAIETSYARHPC